MSKFSGIETADWHLDRFNRLDDMAKCVDFVIDEAIRRKVNVFILNGDGYRTWHPAPIEMNVMHRLVRLVAAGIEVYIVVGNHDWPESGEYKGMHCFMEMKSLNSGIHIMDSVQSIMKDGFLLSFIPHIPKAELQRTAKTYEEYFAAAMDSLATRAYGEAGAVKTAPAGTPQLLFSHVYLREAAVGPLDLMVENDRQITLETLKDDRYKMIFLGDIHKHQVLQDGGPVILYPGSLDRVDFGEANDPKGVVYFEFDGNRPLNWEFVRTPARRFEHLEINLADFGEGAEIQDKVIAWLKKQDNLKDTVVKLTFRCSPEIKKLVSDQVIREALLGFGVNKVRSVNYELDSARVVRAPGIGENMAPTAALERWVELQKYEDGKGDVVLSSGRKIVEAVR